MDKELAGIPVWIWAVGAVVVVGGYLYMRSKSGTSQTSGTSGTSGSAPPQSTSTIKETITDIQSHPKKVK